MATKLTPRIKRPLIVIGNGGSGSTLLDRMLDAHPDMEMMGEMNFLVANAWAAFHRADANTTLRELHSHFDADPDLESRIKKDPAQLTAFLRHLGNKEFERRGAVLRRSIAAWFCLDESHGRFWGFKEITNGGSQDWTCYDYVFPEARWVHIVRHPLDWLPAAARLSGNALSDETIPGHLRTWVANVVTSRQRAATGRYHEIKYEDLQAEPALALSPLLNSLGLDWHRECALPLSRQWGTVSTRLPLPLPKIREYVSAIDGLEQIMFEYGYSVACAASSAKRPQTPRTCLEPMGAGRWRIVAPILRENGNCWRMDLSDLDIVDKLAAIADDVGHWERSPLRLFENDEALGPAHALHFRIRRDGGGRYSHWQRQLLFSTTDNSSPNDNGRVYSFDLKGCAGENEKFASDEAELQSATD